METTLPTVYRIPRRANRYGRYTAQCYSNGKRCPSGDLDCGTDKAAAQEMVRKLITPTN